VTTLHTRGKVDASLAVPVTLVLRRSVILTVDVNQRTTDRPHRPILDQPGPAAAAEDARADTGAVLAPLPG